MAKSVEYRWEIYRIAARNIFVGNVVARDERDALRLAVKNLSVRNPEHQKRLVARRQEPVGAEER